MAKMPDITALGNRPTADPSMGVVGTRGVTGAETVIGEALAGVGRQLGAVGREWEQELKVEKDKFDRIRAEDAFNKLEDERLRLQMGDDGFAKKKGADAINPQTSKDYGQRFTDAEKAILGTLQNDEQKRLFQLRSSVSRRAYNQALQSHVFQEDAVYRKGVYEGGIDTSYRAAIASWNNASDVQAQLVRIDALIKERGIDQGWSKGQVDLEKARVASQIHAGVIGQALAAEQTGYAKQWYDQHKGEVDQQTAQRLFREIERETQKTLFNGYNRVLSDNRTDRRTLTELEKAVANDAKLDDGMRVNLLNGIRSKIDSLDRKAEMAQMKWERQIERNISAMNSRILSGFDVTPEQFAPLLASTKGTAFEADVKQSIALAETTRQFRLATPQQQERMITEMTQQAQANPNFDIGLLQKYQSIYESQQRAVRQDPITFGIRQGLIPPNDLAAQPIDWSKPESLAPQLAAVAAAGRAMSQRYGVPFKMLTKEQTDGLSAAIQAIPVQQRSAYLGQLSRSLSDDPSAYKAVMAQIAPDQPVVAVAGAYAANYFRDPNGKAVADLILRGQHILQPNRKEDGTPDRGKLWPMPPEKDLRTAFESYENGAYAGNADARNAHYQTALAIYAAKISDKGTASDVLDSKLWQESIKLATGGIERWNGRSTVMPYGMQRGDFRDQLKLRVDALASSGLLDDRWTPSRLWDLPLRAVGDGTYKLISGDSVVTDKNGRDVVVDFNAPPPIRAKTPRGGAIGETAEGAVTGRVR